MIIDNGIADFNTVDFNFNGPVQLKGKWKFKWMESSPYFASTHYDDSQWDLFEMPLIWNKSLKTGEGYAWYRLKIINNKNINLALQLSSALTAYKIYVNGILLMNNGSPGKNKKSSIPQRKPQLKPLPDSSEYVIAVYLSNYHGYRGGFHNPLKIGLMNDLIQEEHKSHLYIVFILGIILIMIIYHFFLWFGHKNDKSYLYFALFALTILLRLIVINNFLTQLFDHPIWYFIQRKIDYLTIPTSSLFLYLLFYQIFQEDFIQIIYRLLCLTSYISTFIILCSPPHIYSIFLYYFQFMLIIKGMFLFYTIIKAVVNKRKGSLLSLSGFLIIFIAVINDIISVNYENYEFPLAQIALVYFIFIQQIILSRRLSFAYNRANYLSQNLQEEVTKQTKQINEQNRQLIQMNQEKTNFFVNLAHETKTPLTLISNYLDKDIRQRGKSKDIDIVKMNIDILLKNMVNFLDIEKLNRGKQFYNHDQIINLSQITQQKFLLFKELSNKKSITLTSIIEDDLFIKMDPHGIDRIINNLMDNAIRYTPENGKIQLQLLSDKNLIKLIVNDSGFGISQDKLENIFKPYYQISNTKSNLQGIGIGLSIVKKMVDDVNGKINVTSIPFQGTQFTISFNRSRKKNKTLQTNSIKLSKPIDNIISISLNDRVRDGFKNILLVEDNLELLDYLLNSLSENFNCYYATNGLHALDRLNSIPVPDIIISDIMMDQMDGNQFYQKLKEDPRFISVPFIFLTAHSDLEIKIESLKKGAIDFITKPFNINELIYKITSWTRIQDALSKKTLTQIENKLNEHTQLNEKSGSQKTEIKNKFKISQKELEVISLLKLGLEYKEISDKLMISINTVHTYIRRIYKKCNINNRIELLNIFHYPINESN